MFASNPSLSKSTPSNPYRRSRRPPGGVTLTILTLLWWWACREISERAATGLLGWLLGGVFVPLLAATFLFFLVVLGLLALDMLRGERVSVRQLIGLPKRLTSGREWLLGAAVGWGVVVVAVLPLALRRALYVQTGLAPSAVLAAVLALATLGLATLTTETVFRGYALRRLESSFGPNGAMIALAGIYAVLVSFSLRSLPALLVAFLLAILLTMAWRRTFGLWLGWGVHFAWNAALAILFGLPLFSGTELSSIVQAQAQGPRPLTGGGLGPVAAPWTAVVLVGAMVVLFLVTREYAWAYTHAPIVAAGYPLDVPPPKAHTAMEQSAPPPPLVQILPTTPQGQSRTDPLP